MASDTSTGRLCIPEISCATDGYCCISVRFCLPGTSGFILSPLLPRNRRVALPLLSCMVEDEGLEPPES